MTIFTPHHNQTIKHFLLILFALLLVGGVLYIFEYNSLVNARFALNNLKKDLVGLQAQNADLKNQLYTVIDPAKLAALAASKGLILEGKPQYVTNQWVPDSTH